MRRPPGDDRCRCALGGLYGAITWGLSSGRCFLQRGLRRQALHGRDGSHALDREHAPALQLPVLILLQPHRTHEAGDRGVVREDVNHPSAAFDLLIDAIEQVGAPVLLPMLLREVAERQQVLPGLSQWPPADFVYSSAALGKRSAREPDTPSQRLRISPAFSWANTLRRAALPDAALQLAADGLGEAQMGVTDHQLDPSESVLLEVGDEFSPECLAFAVTHLQADQYMAAVGIDAHGDHSSPGADLQGPAQLAVEVGGNEIDVGVAGLLERPVQKGLHLLVDLLADAAHL